MPTEIDELRDFARAYWSGRPIPCPKHPGAMLTGSCATVRVTVRSCQS